VNIVRKGSNTSEASHAQDTQAESEPTFCKKWSEDEREKWQAIVYRYRVSRMPPMTYEEIVERLAAGAEGIHPPVRVHHTTVLRWLKGYYERYGTTIGTRAQIVEMVVNALHTFNHASNAFRRIAGDIASSRMEKIAALRSLVETEGKRLEFAKDIGLLDTATRQFALNASGGQADETIPTGDQLREYFQDVTVDADELLSDAERAIRYGDHAALPAHVDDPVPQRTKSDPAA
jgi:hypothetical protein